MKTKFFLWLFVLSSWLPLARSGETLDPAKTWVFMVGIADWSDDIYESYPQKNRSDVELAALFQKLGVPQEQIKFLKDKEAKKDAITKEFSEFAAKADGTLIVYYGGHSGKDDDGATYFVPYNADESLQETGWSTESILDTIQKKFKGPSAILLADADEAGDLVEKVATHKTPLAYLGSALFSKTFTGNWTFTQSLIAGFGGDSRADDDHDGKITFGELTKFTEMEMAFAEGLLAANATAKFSMDLVIATAKAAPNARYGERVVIGEGEDSVPAHVVETDEKRLNLQHYGYGAKCEWIDASRVHAWKPKSYPVGDKVEVLWPTDGSWYPSVILEGKLGIHKIHYEGFGDDLDEWVSSDLIRPVEK